MSDFICVNLCRQSDIISDDHDFSILNLFPLFIRWAAIASHLPGRTDNEIKNLWNTHLRKKLLKMGLDPMTHRPRTDHLNLLTNLHQILAAAKIVSSFTNPSDINNALRLHSNLAKFQSLQQNMFQLTGASNSEPLNPFAPLNSLQDGFVNDVLGLNHHSNLLNLQLDDDSLFQMHPSFQNFEALQQPTQDGSLNADPSPSNSLPNLVSASPESSPVKEAEKVNANSKDCSNPCSTTFELTWGDFMDEDATETYWKGFIDQHSNQTWSTVP